jgi:hypothetical protein
MGTSLEHLEDAIEHLKNRGVPPTAAVCMSENDDEHTYGIIEATWAVR